jgi:hypothetical protein
MRLRSSSDYMSMLRSPPEVRSLIMGTTVKLLFLPNMPKAFEIAQFSTRTRCGRSCLRRCLGAVNKRNCEAVHANIHAKPQNVALTLYVCGQVSRSATSRHHGRGTAGRHSTALLGLSERQQTQTRGAPNHGQPPSHGTPETCCTCPPMHTAPCSQRPYGAKSL